MGDNLAITVFYASGDSFLCLYSNSYGFLLPLIVLFTAFTEVICMLSLIISLQRHLVWNNYEYYFKNFPICKIPLWPFKNLYFTIKKEDWDITKHIYKTCFKKMKSLKNLMLWIFSRFEVIYKILRSNYYITNLILYLSFWITMSLGVGQTTTMTFGTNLWRNVVCCYSYCYSIISFFHKHCIKKLHLLYRWKYYKKHEDCLKNKF